MANSLNGSVHNLLGKVIGTNITSNGENFSTKSFDFTLYCLKTFGVNAMVATSGERIPEIERHLTYSLMTTFAPSFEKRRAVERPIP
jgi:hypothetical protein